MLENSASVMHGCFGPHQSEPSWPLPLPWGQTPLEALKERTEGPQDSLVGKGTYCRASWPSPISRTPMMKEENRLLKEVIWPPHKHKYVEK